jgi:hypothetical protein
VRWTPAAAKIHTEASSIPQLEAEDEVVADAEAVAEGEGPPAPGENGIAFHSKEDIHRPA